LNSKVTYSGNMGAVGFFLEKQGYKVLLNDTNDIKALDEHYSGHPAGNDKDAYYHYLEHETINGNQTKPNYILHSHAYEVTFPGSSPNPVIVPDKAYPSYNNYYIGNDPSKWTSNCKIYGAVLYKNIYPNIDVRYYSNNGQLKYDIIVNPGGDISKIALQFNGADGLSIKNGNLMVKTSVGSVTELAPLAYQLDNNVRTSVDAKFQVSGNTVYFKTGNYSKTATLVIDPTLIFVSFVKSLSDNWGYTATYDNAGNFYAGGIVFDQGYPTEVGSFQQNYTPGGGSNEIGGYDVGVIKLSPDGVNKIFATYLGGSDLEQPHSLVVDNAGNLVVAGRTRSTNFPVKSPFFGTKPGGYEIFIAVLNSTGSQLVGSRLFGGSGDDGVNIADKEIVPSGPNANFSIRRNYGDDARSEVIVDASDNIYLASCTQSSDFLATPGAFQTTFGGGPQDGVVIKTSPDVSTVLFSSFLGGNQEDAAFVLSLNPKNNDIYVGGATVSTNLPGTGGNSGPILFSTYQGGQSDGFVSIISNDGTTLRKTAYVGTAGNDMVYGVQFDKFGNPYIMGTTSVSFPVLNVAFTQESNGKEFITKLQPDLSAVQYSTNFGKGQSDPDISPIAFLVDRCENVYVSGWGGGINKGEGYPDATTINLSVTPNAIQSTTDGKDFYFFVLEKNGASQLYGSFYGENSNLTGNVVGDHVDGGTSRFDRQGIIYQAICANCGATSRAGQPPGTGFPTTQGVWGPTNVSITGARCNEVALKIAFELAGVTAAIKSTIRGIPMDTSGCIPMAVDFADTIAIAKQYIWDFGDGSPQVQTTSRTTSHTYVNVGTYKVTLIAIDSSSCNISDTIYANIRARNDFAQLGLTAQKLNPCDSFKYQFTNTSVAPAGKPFTNQSFLWDFGDGTTLISDATTLTHSYAAAGTYTVTLNLVDTNYCNYPDADSVQLRISSIVKALFTVAPGCAPYNAVFNNISEGGQQFTWDFGDGTTSTDVNPVHLYTTPGTYTIKMVAVDSATCNKIDSTTGSLFVGPKPVSNFTVTPIPAQQNIPATFTNNSTAATSYLWDFGDGSTLNTIQIDTLVTHQYIATGNYKACLIAYNDVGCTDTSCNAVPAIIVPLVDVPNAFTPNGDGVNDEVHVRGFGVAKMNWRIFNRWGAMVFQSTSVAQGWNGYYKGVLQPQEVYTYVLDITFSDGTAYRKKGDITLLR